jgi:hypothetical protein
MQQPQIRTIRTVSRPAKPINWTKAANNLRAGLQTTNKYAKRTQNYVSPKAKKLIAATKTRYQRAGGINGFRSKLKVMRTGSIYNGSIYNNK